MIASHTVDVLNEIAENRFIHMHLVCIGVHSTVSNLVKRIN